MSLLGLILILLMGFTLGLLGGGGSILSVPILVYTFSMSAITATSYSLFIVGCTALVGAVKSFKKGNVDINSAITLSFPGVLGVSLSRRYLIPSIPDTLYSFEALTISKDNFILLCFSILMIIAAFSMILDKKEFSKKTKEHSILFKVLLGFLIGLVTGFVGAGGGFIIVPVLIKILGLDIRKAIGTSLLIISFNSIIGFFGGVLGSTANIPLISLFALSIIGSLGLLIGIYFNKFVPAKTLKKGFGVFVLILGSWIIMKQI